MLLASCCKRGLALRFLLFMGPKLHLIDWPYLVIPVLELQMGQMLFSRMSLSCHDGDCKEGFAEPY